MSAQNLDHVIKRRRQSGTRRGADDRPLVQLGDKVARQIEAAYDLGEGWFDWPFEGVDFKTFASLNIVQRAIVEGQLIVAIREAAKQQHSQALEPVGRKAVSDRKVEKHLPLLSREEVKAAHEHATRRSRERASVTVTPKLRQRPLVGDPEEDNHK